jgi:hypothetical protein
MVKEKDKIKLYSKDISLTENYITQNINKLIKDKKELDFIKNNIFLLGITNKLGKNSLNILLENFNDKIIKEFVEYDVRILRYKNRNEKNLLMSMITNENLYEFINKLIKSEKNNIIENYYSFKITILSEIDNNGNTFIDLCINLINLNFNLEFEKIKPLIEILKSIYELDKEEIFLIITKLCRDIEDSNILIKIIEYIEPKNLDIYPDINNNTSIDYLIMLEKINVLKYLIDKVEHVYFVNFEENTLLTLLDNLKDEKITKEMIEIIFKILSKSNINKLRDMYNENLLQKLLKIFKLKKETIKNFIKYFDIFEQNTQGENIYNILINNYSNDIEYILEDKYYIDSQIKIKSIDKIKIIRLNYDFDIKHFLRKTHYGIFISDYLHNMIYTRIILERNDILLPYLKTSEMVYKNNLNYLLTSNNDKDILGIIRFYFYNFNNFMPHLIIWKDKTNYFIHSELINLLKIYSQIKRFVYIKLSIIATNKIQGNIRHANLILIDNLKKTVERFEPYGEIYFSNCLEINNVLEKEIANKMKYEYIFTQPYPGFQIRSDEFDDKNKSYGDPGGFCLAWCFLYLELKIYYENKIKKESIEQYNNSEIIIKLINNYIINIFTDDFKNLKEDKQQNLYMTFIRYYAKSLDKSKNKLIKKYGINISTIYHLNLDDKIYKKIIYNLNKDIEKIILKQ